MTLPKLRDYMHALDGLGELPVYRTTNEDGQEICTILRPDEGDGEKIDQTWTLRDYLYYSTAHPNSLEATNALDILEEVAALTY